MPNIYLREETEKPKQYQSFYTDAEEINLLMISLLGDIQRAKVLEPCAGRGAFVRPLLHAVDQIHAIDIDNAHVRELRSIKSTELCVQEGDFVDYFIGGTLTSHLLIDTDYDAVICNPPYGLKFSLSYRKAIKVKYPGLYARESYGLFMVFGLQCLKEGGRLVYIVPDTFLTSTNHRSLRYFLRDNLNVTHLVQFNSSRFKTVKFGYANLCIIAGNRSSEGQTGDITWLDHRGNESPLTLCEFGAAESVPLSDFKKATNHGWISPKDETNLFASSYGLLGEIADCRTGIYTGENRKYCAFDELSPPLRTNGHPITWNNVRSTDDLIDFERTEGVCSPPYYVPFIRGGHRLPFEETKSALNWSNEAVHFYRTNRKSRLQNLPFYFREGIAVPMVTSGHLSASYMKGAVFDQGVVGIFPKNERWLEFLLVFLNSEFATTLKRSISPGANNSANYLKRLRIPLPEEIQLREAAQVCTRWRSKHITDKKTIVSEATIFVAGHFLPSQVAG